MCHNIQSIKSILYVKLFVFFVYILSTYTYYIWGWGHSLINKKNERNKSIKIIIHQKYDVFFLCNSISEIFF